MTPQEPRDGRGLSLYPQPSASQLCLWLRVEKASSSENGHRGGRRTGGGLQPHPQGSQGKPSLGETRRLVRTGSCSWQEFSGDPAPVLRTPASFPCLPVCRPVPLPFWHWEVSWLMSRTVTIGLPRGEGSSRRHLDGWRPCTAGRSVNSTNRAAGNGKAATAVSPERPESSSVHEPGRACLYLGLGGSWRPRRGVRSSRLCPTHRCWGSRCCCSEPLLSLPRVS